MSGNEPPRTPPEAHPPGIVITLLHAGIRIRGAVTDTHLLDEAGARLLADFDPALPTLPIGERLDTELTAPNARTPVRLAGRLVSQEQRHASVRCCLAYGVVHMRIIRSLMDLRRAVRVSPSPSLPVTARVAAGIGVQVYDISTGGVALLLSEEDQGRLDSWTIQLGLSLPGAGHELDLHGKVRVRRLCGAAILYGIAFDENLTLDFAAKQDLIHKYVMRRQAEMLREHAERSEEGGATRAG